MDSDSRQSPVYIPKGVTDSFGRTGYFSKNGGVLEAIDLLSGNTVWTTTNAGYPLIVWNESLIAFRHLEGDETSIQIIVFDRRGNPLPDYFSEPVKFPAKVQVTGKDDLFSLRVYLDQDTLVLVWSAKQLYTGGAARVSQASEETASGERGQVRIKLKTGKIEQSSGESFDNPSTAANTPFQDDRFYEISSWEIGNKKASLLWDLTATIPAVYLRLWSSENSPDYRQTKIAAGEGLIPQVTLDCRHILIYREREPGLKDSFVKKSQIFAVETGKLISAFYFENVPYDISVITPNVLYTFEETVSNTIRLILKARNIHTGVVLWERLLQEKRLSRTPSLRQ